MSVRNYRALADVKLELRPINVVFGPNGAGKSTLLDSLYFFRDCAIRGVAAGSLYMSGTVAPQGADAFAESDG